MPWPVGDLEPDVEHVAGCYLVPVSFEVSTEGWRSRGGTPDTLFLSWSDPEDEDFVVNLGLAVDESAGDLQSEMQAVVEKDRISSLGPVVETTVAGVDAYTPPMLGVIPMRIRSDSNPWSR